MKKGLSSQMENLYHDIMSDIDSPTSLGIWLMIKWGDFDQLASLKRPDPALYQTPHDFMCADVPIALVRKYNGWLTSFNTAENAVKAWYEAERKCFRTNFYLNDILTSGVSYDTHTLVARSILDIARKIVYKVLGNAPKLDALDIGFGPGTTLSDPRKRSTLLHKMCSAPTTTELALQALPGDSSWFIRRLRSSPKTIEIVRGDRFETVPKNAKIDRGISIQPSYLCLYQRGLGRAIRARLRQRSGLDIKSAQESHRLLARIASSRGELATIDLEAASDTISLSLVKALLPQDWYHLLYIFRSPFTTVSGKCVRLEKFAAMGNGYTFELETLIFYALCKATEKYYKAEPLIVGSNFSVYGDDIIIPVKVYDRVVQTLTIAGFSLNTSKSFATGPFRESCGGDFYDGTDVTPYYLKGEPSNPVALRDLHNGLMLLSDRFGCCFSTSLRRIRQRLKSKYGSLTLFGPSPEGLIGPRSKWITRERYILDQTTGERLPTQCIEVLVLSPIIQRYSIFPTTGDELLAAALLGISSNGLTPRGDPIGYQKRWIPLMEG